MNREELIKILHATETPDKIAKWLREQYFPEIMNRYNSEASRKRFGLYRNEQIPSNERNLTDVRTRMGVLIEFELARISNEILPELGIDDVFWSYVVANRFPDLEIRENNGNRLLRLEIKCLQCVAEEKSANFDTLIKDINPNTDFVIVCLWDWDNRGNNICQWDSAPKLFKIYVFHAYSLAQLRDTYWLNKPPVNLGTGYQGFDVRYAVTCADSVFSKEQGNYGKLTRIWKEGFEYRPVETPALLDTEAEYIKFQKEIIKAGFEILAKKQLSELCKEEISYVVYGGQDIGYSAGNIGYVMETMRKSKAQEIALQNRLSILVSMTEKYRSTIYKIEQDSIDELAKNEKPKNVVNIINQSEN